jgi:hypothetical protein
MGLCSCKSKFFKYFQAAAKKKGVKSTLGRIFGKKDKQLKSMKLVGKHGNGTRRARGQRRFRSPEKEKVF